MYIRSNCSSLSFDVQSFQVQRLTVNFENFSDSNLNDVIVNNESNCLQTERSDSECSESTVLYSRSNSINSQFSDTDCGLVEQPTFISQQESSETGCDDSLNSTFLYSN